MTTGESTEHLRQS